nr:tau-cadinol synthase-like isoform X2 [Setaria viridis]
MEGPPMTASVTTPVQKKWLENRVSALKEKVRLLFEDSKDIIEQMNLVDTIQHLGIGHHFEKEIANTLCNIQHMEFNTSSLHEVSLRFRLLREHSLWVSPDEFNRFKDTNGSFNMEMTNDPRGLLSLYNAAYMFIHDEALEEAISFARLHLESMRYNLKYPLSEQVNRALHIPLPRTVRRVETLHYMSEYKHEREYNPNILELAKIDFNNLQQLHIKEIEAISKWDESVVSILPEYLKKFYLRILRTFKEIQDMLAPNEQYKVSYAQKSFQTLSNYYLQGAEWFHCKKTPTFKERVEASLMDSGGSFSCVALLVGMGDIASKEALDWALGCTGAVRACGLITRYMNDITALKHGNREQDAANSVECYIAEYNVASEVAIANIYRMVEDAWKTLNKDLLELGSLHPAVRRVIDATASLTLMYGDKKDTFTFGDDLESLITRLFFSPITI